MCDLQSAASMQAARQGMRCRSCSSNRGCWHCTHQLQLTTCTAAAAVPRPTPADSQARRWDESFELLVHHPEHQQLTAVLLDANTLSKDEPIGQVLPSPSGAPAGCECPWNGPGASWGPRYVTHCPWLLRAGAGAPVRPGAWADAGPAPGSAAAPAGRERPESPRGRLQGEPPASGRRLHRLQPSHGRDLQELMLTVRRACGWVQTVLGLLAGGRAARKPCSLHMELTYFKVGAPPAAVPAGQRCVFARQCCVVSIDRRRPCRSAPRIWKLPLEMTRCATCLQPRVRQKGPAQLWAAAARRPGGWADTFKMACRGWTSGSEQTPSGGAW